MIDFIAVQQALELLFTSVTPWLVVIPGILIGLVFGSIPGLQISMAMAIFLPLTLHMNFVMSMLFLTAIFTGGSFGGGVTAILMNIPGTSSALATAFDGYPMARQGRHNEALGLALGSSTFGCGLGYIVLFALIQPISILVLKLGPSEMFAVTVWGLTLIASLRGDHMSKGIISGVFGLLLGTVGYNELGTARGTLEIELLLDGIPAVPAMMGMFAASELFNLLNAKFIVEDEEQRNVSRPKIFQGFKESLRFPIVNSRGSMLGIMIGAVPGVGSSVANLLSYMETKRRDKDPDSFGHGNPKGVMASESANSSSEAGSMATLLALGIPGGGATAVMLAVFAMNNITGGPTFIREQTDVVYAIIFANFAQVFLLAIIGLLTIPLLASVVKVPVRMLVPSVMALAIFGSYGLTGSMAGPYTVLVFACLGYVMKKYNYSVPGLVIGILLGKMAESELLHSYQISGGQISYVFSRPVTLFIVVLLLLSIGYQPIMKFVKARWSHRKS
ncbi:putative tricarboxylic transport membrane protein [Desulfuromusa kysingii]|uniref:Putative tricarboxylic transport membrane protein n=1 Tax=Desulfuromusa kysingii TaxID=37625 RepID=A0A1H4DX76_9BACT|nr:tripartite tricarboxylate transporter permease [Desulfuromusa kysingii]SEA77187.1 putative tricarboxylic transport membrane protein [Desulfuromusa kysingii]